MSVNAYPEHIDTFTENQSPAIIPLVWIEAETGNIVHSPQYYSMKNGGAPLAPTQQAPQAPAQALYDLNIEKFTRKGAKYHAELQERLQRGEKRYPAIKGIAARINKPASYVELYLKQYIDHLKAEKEQEYRSAILSGMKANKTNKQIAKDLGRHEKTIADRRREIERELLEGAE